MERSQHERHTMQVLLEVIPQHDPELRDYEAFTINTMGKATDVFCAEYRKLSGEFAEKLEEFLDGPLVRRRLRAAFSRDISFTDIDFNLCLLGNDREVYTYRLSPYKAGKHSR